VDGLQQCIEGSRVVQCELACSSGTCVECGPLRQAWTRRHVSEFPQDDDDDEFRTTSSSRIKKPSKYADFRKTNRPLDKFPHPVIRTDAKNVEMRQQ